MKDGLIIDTSIIIALERGKVSTKQWSHYGQAYISLIVLTELLIIGIDRVNNENKRIKCLAFIEYVKSLFTILPFGIEKVYTYARIIHDLSTYNYRNS